MVTRRQFLKGGLALTLPLLVGGRLWLGEKEKPYLIESTHSIMGTFVKIAVVDTDVEKARTAIDSAFDEIYNINDRMSVFREDSEVGVLNREGYGRVSADTTHVLKRASHFSELSNGAFGIAVLPMMTLWQKRGVPAAGEIAETLALLEHRNIAIENGNARFNKEGMGITLGGIAKGFAVDQAIETLQKNGVSHALVSAGGDIRAIGDKADRGPWRVALRNPQDKSDSIASIELRDRAVATSGNYERYYDPEASVPHIIDPRTGYPAQGLMSVTTVATTALDADALSTAVFVLGAEEGLRLVEKAGAEALIITNDRRIIKTGGFA